MASDQATEMEETGLNVTDDDVKAFEAKVGAALPDDYRAFLLGPNGGRPVHRDFRAGKAGEVTLNDLLSLHDPHSACALESDSPSWMPKELLAIGNASGGVIAIVLQGEHRGSIWYVDAMDARPEDSNPRVLWHDRRDFIKVAGNFDQFMALLTTM